MIDEDGHKFFLCNEGDYKKILEDMQLQAVFEDILTNDAEPTMVPKKNFRGNRGPSLQFTGSLSTKRGSTAQFAKPLLRAGSRRYWPLYVKVTKAIWKMASHRILANSRCFSEPFPIQADMTDHTREWGGSVAEGNCIESCSFLMYTSAFSFSKDSIDRLVSHVDQGNGRKEGRLGLVSYLLGTVLRFYTTPLGFDCSVGDDTHFNRRVLHPEGLHRKSNGFAHPKISGASREPARSYPCDPLSGRH
jgi:hypothetical protein